MCCSGSAVSGNRRQNNPIRHSLRAIFEFSSKQPNFTFILCLRKGLVWLQYLYVIPVMYFLCQRHN